MERSAEILQTSAAFKAELATIDPNCNLDYDSIIRLLRIGELINRTLNQWSNKLSADVILSRRNQIRSLHSRRWPAFSIVPEQLTYLFELYSRIFFGGYFEKLLQTGEIVLVPNSRLVKSIGRCGYNDGRYTIDFNADLIHKISSDPNPANRHLGEISCHDPLSCTQLVIEHEMIHLYCKVAKLPETGHGSIFKEYLTGMFGHKDIKHRSGLTSDLAGSTSQVAPVADGLTGIALSPEISPIWVISPGPSSFSFSGPSVSGPSVSGPPIVAGPPAGLETVGPSTFSFTIGPPASRAPVQQIPAFGPSGLGFQAFGPPVFGSSGSGLPASHPSGSQTPVQQVSTFGPLVFGSSGSQTPVQQVPAFGPSGSQTSHGPTTLSGKANFKIGQSVKFQHRNAWIHGSIIKLNNKTAKVQTIHDRWNVAYSLLKSSTENTSHLFQKSCPKWTGGEFTVKHAYPGMKVKYVHNGIEHIGEVLKVAKVNLLVRFDGPGDITHMGDILGLRAMPVSLGDDISRLRARDMREAHVRASHMPVSPTYKGEYRIRCSALTPIY